MEIIEIPIELTGEDALVIARFLERIVTAIWHTYGRDMAEVLEAWADAEQEEVYQEELPF
jgi:hypothetical protein